MRLWITTVLSSVSFLLSVAPSTFATETTTVVLVWNANTESDVAGYRVHYGTASAPYSSLVAVSSPTATISNLTNGYTYTFAVTAYNTAARRKPILRSRLLHRRLGPGRSHRRSRQYFDPG